MKKTLIIIGGPTAIGKTQLAIKLSQNFQSEIVSADARQFYKELNIGVAKPSQEELNNINHHFIGHISIKQQYSVGTYEQDALQLLNKLFKKYNVIFMCGGSGLYIDSVTEGLHDFPVINKKIKQVLEKDLIKKGINYLNNKLKSVDIETYNKIDKKNPRRVIRALEVYLSSGKTYSFYKTRKIKKRNFNTLFIKLEQSRDILYNNINNRVDSMIKNGLIEEAKKLYKYRNYPALQTIGYQELFKYFDEKYSLEKAVDEIKKNTRRYAKRQITWFKKEKYYVFNNNDCNSIINLISNQIK